VGDWSTVVLDLQQDGTAISGELTTRDGQTFLAAGTISNDTGAIGVTVTGECPGVTFVVSGVDRDGNGQAIRFFGEMRGRCCRTVFQQYQFVRVPGA
jgi:hypothetical protein